MGRIFRVIYPFLIYTAITNLVALGGLMCSALWETVRVPGMEVSQALFFAMEGIIKYSVYWTALSGVITTVILWFFFRRDCWMRGQRHIFSSVNPGAWIYLALLGISICIAGNNFIEMIHLTEVFDGYDAVAKVLYSVPFAAQLLCLGVLIPIAEEMVFRVLGYRRMRDYISFWPAAFLSAAAFGLFHGNLVQGVYAFFLGLVIAYAYELTDNPLVPVFIHGCANVISVLWTALPEFISKPGTGVLVAETVLFLIIAIFSLIKIKNHVRTRKAALS